MGNPRRPNILFLTDDEHRWDFYTGGLIDGLETPTVDRLKRMGVTFPNAFSNCPVCMPTRFTWLTGLYASQSPSGPRNAKDWPYGHKTVAHALQRAGYRTAIIGKLHSHCGRTMAEHHLVELEKHTYERGFDYVFECQGAKTRSRYTDHITEKYGEGFYRRVLEDIASRDHRIGGTNLYSPSFLPIEDRQDVFITNEVVRWLSERPSDKPFFLHASLTGPHFPHDPPEPYFSRHRPDDMPPPVGVDDPGEMKYWREQRAAYCGMIEHTDHLMGRMLDEVEANGLLQDTIIVFSSDHGDMMGDHRLFYKIHPYDASIRTPTVVCDPASRRAGGTVLTDMVEAVDIPATFLEAGTDEHLQDAMPTSLARSFLRYARGEVDSHREWAFCEHGNFCEEGARVYRLARDLEWKYVFYDRGNMLFNIKEDPFEQDNVVDDEGERKRVVEMQARIIRRMGAMMAPPESLETNMPVEFYKGVLP
jgi:arylsulfatase A-like enzyme